LVLRDDTDEDATVQQLTLFPPLAVARDLEQLSQFIARPGQFIVSLGDGVTVELVGLSRNPSSDQPWWRPDGSPLPNRPYYNTVASFSSARNGRKSYEICLKVNTPQQDSSMSWSASGSSGSGSIRPRDGVGKFTNFLASAQLFPADVTTTDIKVAVAVGPWEPVLVRRAGGQSEDIEPVRMIVQPQSDGKGPRVEITESFRWWGQYATRFIAVDHAGKTYFPDEEDVDDTNRKDDLITYRYGFPAGLKLEDIKEFRFEMRRYRHGEFRNVSLSLGRQTDVQILTSSADKTTIGPMSFGPVVERVVNDISTGRDCFLNLATGELLNPGIKLGNRWEDLHAWAKAHDADVVADEDGNAGSQRGLTLFGGFAVGPHKWDEATAESVIKTAQAIEAGLAEHPERLPFSKMRAAKNTTPVFIFKTRQGRLGILQILALPENPRGVKLRYKLVQNLPAKP